MAPPLQEFDCQRAFCIWLDGNPDKAGTPRTKPALAPGVLYWHTPNGGERRDAFEGMRLNQIGLKKGIHDIFFLRPTQFTEGVFGLLFGMEWKKPDAKRAPIARRSAAHLEWREQLVTGGHAPERLVDTLGDSQLEMHPRLLRAGLAASCVVDSLEAAREFCWLHSLALR